MKPVFLFAFANDREGEFLRNIAAEQKAISAALDDVRRAGFCEVVMVPDATGRDILDAFRTYRNRIRLFHYGGHANDYQLLLRSAEGEQEVMDARNFGRFLAQQEGLELVFMNGCSTQEQEESLFQAGVKRIILTSRAISDEAAQTFASAFYAGIASGATISQAFEEAAAGVTLSGEGTSRGSLFTPGLEADSTDLPWHIRPEKVEDSWALKIRRPSPWRYAALAIVAVLLTALTWGVFGPKPEPFAFTVLIQDENGKPLPVMKAKDTRPFIPEGDSLMVDYTAGGSLVLRLDDTPRAGTVDADGNVIFTGIPAKFRGEEVPVEWEVPYFVPAEENPRILLSGKNGTFRLKLSKALCCVFGRVRNANNEFLSGAEVMIDTLKTTTNEEGRFEFHLPREKSKSLALSGKAPGVIISVLKEGYHLYEGTVFPGDPAQNKPIEITLISR